MQHFLLLTPPHIIIKYHGFLLWRYESNDTTCIKYKSAQGDQKIIAVKDAKFRSVQYFGTYGIDSSLSNFTTLGVRGNWLNGSNQVTHNQPIPDTINNDTIFADWSTALRLDKTAKENCNIWMTYNNITDSQGTVGVPAVAWCRNQNIQGRPCDLPNQYQLICIWACGDILDELDPTANQYPGLKLGYTATEAWAAYGRCQIWNNKRSAVCFSSTDYSSTHTLMACWDGNLYYSGYPKNTNSTVIPILEI